MDMLWAKSNVFMQAGQTWAVLVVVVFHEYIWHHLTSVCLFLFLPETQNYHTYMCQRQSSVYISQSIICIYSYDHRVTTCSSNENLKVQQVSEYCIRDKVPLCCVWTRCYWMCVQLIRYQIQLVPALIITLLFLTQPVADWVLRFFLCKMISTTIRFSGTERYQST